MSIDSIGRLDERMKVVAHEPASWLLLHKKSAYYLEVPCSLYGNNFNLLIKLTEDECKQYEKFGKAFIQDMVVKIQYFPQAYYTRNQSIALQKAVGEAILARRR
jgi:hypothetical protein